MIENILKNLNIDERETSIYLTLLESGRTPAGQLAKKLGIRRPSLYGFLKEMQEKGIIVETQEGKIKCFVAEPPEKISLLFKQKIENLEEGKKQYSLIIDELRGKSASQFISPKFQLYEGREGVKFVLQDMLLYANIETQALWPIKSMLKVLGPDFFRYLNKERIKNNIYTRAIWPEKQKIEMSEHPYLGTGKNFKREIRIAPKNIDFKMGYWIYGNKIAFISSETEKFGYIIESAELAHLQKTQFELMWRASKGLVIDPSITNTFIEELKRYK